MVEQHLAVLLVHHREEIAAAWAELVRQLPDSHYPAQPLEELRASTTRGLGAIIAALTTGSYTALETYLTDVSLTRLQMGFDIAEVIEAVLLCKEAAMPIIWKDAVAMPSRQEWQPTVQPPPIQAPLPVLRVP